MKARGTARRADRRLLGTRRAMTNRLAAAILLVAAAGCRMCSDSCDYSSPVADGPYAGTYGRAGSAFNGVVLSSPVEETPPVDAEMAAPITQPPGVAAPIQPAPLEPQPQPPTQATP